MGACGATGTEHGCGEAESPAGLSRALSISLCPCVRASGNQNGRGVVGPAPYRHCNEQPDAGPLPAGGRNIQQGEAAPGRYD